MPHRLIISRQSPTREAVRVLRNEVQQRKIEAARRRGHSERALELSRWSQRVVMLTVELDQMKDPVIIETVYEGSSETCSN